MVIQGDLSCLACELDRDAELKVSTAKSKGVIGDCGSGHYFGRRSQYGLSEMTIAARLVIQVVQCIK